MPAFWQDPAGNLSRSRLAALVLAALPALWLAWQAFAGDLGPRPITAAIHETGDWSLRLLWLTLLITPLRRMVDWPRAVAVRRILGVSALAYALAHVVLYGLDLRFDLARIASEIVQRIYLGIGMLGLVGLLILGASSSDSAVRRLGAAEWQSRHRLIYAIAPLALVHFFIQSKLKVDQPVLMAGFLVWLMGWRWLEARGRSHAAGLAALAVLATLATMLIELAWYGLFTGIAASRIFFANFDFDFEIRMMWFVLAATLGAALTQALRGRTPSRRSSGKDAPQRGAHLRAGQFPGVQGL